MEPTKASLKLEKPPETLQQFLARGGTITKCPPKPASNYTSGAGTISLPIEVRGEGHRVIKQVPVRDDDHNFVYEIVDGKKRKVMQTIVVVEYDTKNNYFVEGGEETIISDTGSPEYIPSYISSVKSYDSAQADAPHVGMEAVWREYERDSLPADLRDVADRTGHEPNDDEEASFQDTDAPRLEYLDYKIEEDEDDDIY